MNAEGNIRRRRKLIPPEQFQSDEPAQWTTWVKQPCEDREIANIPVGFL
jgi:hypothetical protein